MTLTRRTLPAVLAGAALVPALAACGGGGGAAAAATPHHATINLRSEGSLGKVLVDSSRRTLYLFGKDRGGRSACSGACAQNWPPAVVSGKPTAGSGVTSSKLGTTTRSDGKRQVTYNGHPLYRFKGDSKAGQANREGLTAFGGIWDVVSAAGARVTARSSNTGAGAY